MLKPSTTDLLVLAQEGDDQAIAALYDKHQSALFRYLWSRVSERQLAEDLTGDVFMRMLTALPRYRPSGAPFRAWLFQIAHNLLVDYFRREGGRMPLPLTSAEHHRDRNEHSDPIIVADHNLTVERVHRAMAKLEATQREVVSLRFLSGLSLREVAAVVGKSENAIKALQHRGMTALRQMLAKEPVIQ